MAEIEALDSVVELMQELEDHSWPLAKVGLYSIIDQCMGVARRDKNLGMVVLLKTGRGS